VYDYFIRLVTTQLTNQMENCEDVVAKEMVIEKVCVHWPLNLIK